MHARTLRGLVLAALAVGVVLLAAGPASAHITASPGEAPAGGYTVQTFGVGHGCEESPTTQVRIQLPEEIPDATPTVNPNWDVEVVTEPLAEPIEQEEGDPLTERESEIVYTAKTPLDPHLRDFFELSFRTPEMPGETLYFPIIQTCAEGETAWIEIPEEGEEEPEHPAASLTITESEGDGHGGGAEEEEAREEGAEEAALDAENAAAETEAVAEESDDDSSSDSMAVAALVIGGLALIIGIVALVSSRRSPA